MSTAENELAEVMDAFSKFKTNNDDRYKDLQEQVDRIEAAANRPRTGGSDSWLPPNNFERKAFASYLRHGNQTPAEKLNALTVSSDTQAGYMAPAEVASEFVRNLVEFSPIRSVASVRTTGADAVRYPTRIGITNAQWEGELEESEESRPAFGMAEVPVRKLQTFVDLSNELIADSGDQAVAEVQLAFAEDFGRSEAIAFLKGDGVKQPTGLLNDSRIQSTASGNATAITADALIDLLYKIPATHRNATGFRWGMNGSVLAAVRKLKDGSGNYLWHPGLAAGQPETILGKPVLKMVDLPDVAAGATPIIAGDFTGYRIVDRLSLAVLSDPLTQARRGVTRLHATRRVGGAVLQPGKFRSLRIAAS